MKITKMLLAVFIAFMCFVHMKEDVTSDKYLLKRVVMLKNERGSCSGEQIKAPSGKDYILTAAHCRALAIDNMIDVVDYTGAIIKRKIISEDPFSDLLLLEGLPNLKGIPIAKSIVNMEKLKTYTHGGGFNTWRTDGYAIERRKVSIHLFDIETDQDRLRCKDPKHLIKVIADLFGSTEACFMNIWEMYITAKTLPGSSGGMIVNERGELVGAVSAGDNSNDFTLMIEAKEINEFLKIF